MNNKKIAKELNKIAKELLSVDFPNQKAMNDYLKQHPLAERRNHKVVEFKPENNEDEAFEVGDEVKIKKEWLNSPADGDLTYNVLELRGPRLLIRENNSQLSIPPTESVLRKMVQK